MSEKILLTGISGWIAKHTAIELLNSGYEVLGTVRDKNLIDQTKETLFKYSSIEKLSFLELDFSSSYSYFQQCPLAFKASALFPPFLFSMLILYRDVSWFVCYYSLPTSIESYKKMCYVSWFVT